jgi:hypothetical protein
VSWMGKASPIFTTHNPVASTLPSPLCVCVSRSAATATSGAAGGQKCMHPSLGGLCHGVGGQLTAPMPAQP